MPVFTTHTAHMSTHKPWNRRMGHDYDYRDDDESDEREEAVTRRPAGPRFGPFVTIAVAILLLFGAASRIGKPAENGNWLSIDLVASRNLSQERLRLQEQRNTTLVTLGVLPSAPNQLRAQPESLHMQGQVLPPPRGEVDYHQYRQMQAPPSIPLSMTAQTRGARESSVSVPAPQFDPAPEAPYRASRPAGTQYVVSEGDNWVKIGKATGKKWQDILKANPQAEDGLRVGMKIIIP